MSAYVVDRNHIAYLVQSALDVARRGGCKSFRWWGADDESHELPFGDQEAADKLGQLIWDENIRSVLHRYPQDTRETMPGPIGEDFVYRHDFTMCYDFNVAAILRACHCWEYQTCETPDHKKTAAWAFVDALQRSVASHVPGYKDAAWGAPEPRSVLGIS
jgi:hypothetical protein